MPVWAYDGSFFSGEHGGKVVIHEFFLFGDLFVRLLGLVAWMFCVGVLFAIVSDEESVFIWFVLMLGQDIEVMFKFGFTDIPIKNSPFVQALILKDKHPLKHIILTHQIYINYNKYEDLFCYLWYCWLFVYNLFIFYLSFCKAFGYLSYSDFLFY